MIAKTGYPQACFKLQYVRKREDDDKPDFDRLVVDNFLKFTSLFSLVDKLQQAGKIENLQKVSGVFG